MNCNEVVCWKEPELQAFHRLTYGKGDFLDLLLL